MMTLARILRLRSPALCWAVPTLASVFVLLLAFADHAAGQEASSPPKSSAEGTQAVARDALTELKDTVDALLSATEEGEKTGKTSAPSRDETTKAVQGIVNKAIELKVLYGIDNRKNYYEVSDNLRKAADATAILIDRDLLSKSSDGRKYRLPSDGAGLCSPSEMADQGFDVVERFWNEPAPGFCSGFKVGPDLMATAGHCIQSDSDCKSTSFVFRFYVDSEQANPERNIPAENVYECRRVIAGELDRNGSDWRIVRVHRDIEAPEVAIRGSAERLGLNEKLTVIGYPLGLPVKIADDATVRRVESEYFVASLDTYGGNSGSAVFNSAALSQGELLLEGVLVRGEEDFQKEEPCRISNRCLQDGCRGEDVTLAAEMEQDMKR